MASKSAARKSSARRTPPARLSIREIAKRAGVSVGTVSHVLNRPQIVRAPLRESVLEVIKQSGFQPNAVARSLRQRTTRTVGLVLSDITTPFAARVARIVEDLAAAAGMSVVFADTDEDIGREERAIRTFFHKGVDGIIVAPAEGSHRFLADYLARDWPVVAINRRIDSAAVPAVLPDHAGGAVAATAHALGHGHRRIAAIAPRARRSSVAERIDGYARCLRRAGIPGAGLVVTEDASVEGGIRAAHRVLDLADPPTAVLSFSSTMTLGVIVGLRERGAHVPDDVALIGFDEAAWAIATNPPLTTVNLDPEAVGAHAGRLLFEWIVSKKSPGAGEHRIPTTLIVRESCGCDGLAHTTRQAVAIANLD
ncbi:MAG: LacI family DNA-binding transcriptional regulator [Burkholderiales bacterium]|nr:LacI family DNA-binding transcriptional regulator [Burkholderiales bacterium]